MAKGAPGAIPIPANATPEPPLIHTPDDSEAPSTIGRRSRVSRVGTWYGFSWSLTDVNTQPSLPESEESSILHEANEQTALLSPSSRSETPVPKTYQSTERAHSVESGSASVTIEGDTLEDDIAAVLQQKSSPLQATLNMLNVLMGVAVLSLPFSMASSGFLVGTFLLLAYCSTAAYTAKLLGKCLSYGRPNSGSGKGVGPPTLQGRDSAQTVIENESLLGDSRPSVSSGKLPYSLLPSSGVPFLTTYADVSEAAFGIGARTFIASLFSFELFAAATACVVLLADSLVALWPSWDETTVKVAATALVLFPTTLPRSLAILSYASIIGVVSMLNLIAILFFNGLSTNETPGSLWNPAPTSVLPSAWSSVPLAVGLFVCSVDAHAIFPGIFSDMAEPAVQFPKAINRSYTFLFFCYVAVASAGYLCFGSGTLPEITQNFAQVASYNQIFNKITIFLVAINPACKFALILGPVNYNIEYSFHQWFPNAVDSPLSPTSSIGSIPIRFTTSALVLIVSLLFPRFSQILAIMGAACSSIICIVFPVLCFWRIRAKVAAMGVDPGAATWFDVVAGTLAVIFGALTFVVGSYGAIMHH